MPQQFLHHLKFRTHAPQQRRISVTERVPADAFLDSESLRSRSKIFAQDRLSPIWPPPSVPLAGKDPIVWLLALRASLG